MGLKLLKEKDTFQVTIYNDVSDVRILRHCIEKWLKNMEDVTPYKIFSVKLCLDELVYNAILHAYKNTSKKEKRADIKIAKVGHYIEISVKDYGTLEWYYNYEIPDSVPEEKIDSLHGRGLIIIKAMTEKLNVVNTIDKGTSVQIKINLDEEDE